MCNTLYYIFRFSQPFVLKNTLLYLCIFNHTCHSKVGLEFDSFFFAEKSYFLSIHIRFAKNISK